MALVEGGGIQHIQQATASTISVQFYSDGAVADPGTVTVAITRADGTTLSPAAGATASGTTTAPRTLALSATETAALDILDVTWTSATLGTLTTEVHILGSFLFTIAEARAYQPNAAGGAPLSSTTKYTTAAIVDARMRITDLFQRLTGVSFVRRYQRDVVSGSGTTELLLPGVMGLGVLRSVESRTYATGTWTATDSDDVALVLTDEWGRITSEATTFVSGRANYRIGYEAGYERTPTDVKQAALVALVDELVATNLSDRAISVSDEHGSTQLWTVGYSGRGAAIHRIPYVDSVLQGYLSRTPIIA